jgi:hypothetical protein
MMAVIGTRALASLGLIACRTVTLVTLTLPATVSMAAFAVAEVRDKLANSAFSQGALLT